MRIKKSRKRSTKKRAVTKKVTRKTTTSIMRKDPSAAPELKTEDEPGTVTEEELEEQPGLEILKSRSELPEKQQQLVKEVGEEWSDMIPVLKARAKKEGADGKRKK